MNDNQRDFLLKEFEISWQQILAFDLRRGVFLRYYIFVVGAIILLIANLFASGKPINLVSVVLATMLLQFHICLEKRSEKYSDLSERPTSDIE